MLNQHDQDRNFVRKDGPFPRSRCRGLTLHPRALRAVVIIGVLVSVTGCAGRHPVNEDLTADDAERVALTNTCRRPVLSRSRRCARYERGRTPVKSRRRGGRNAGEWLAC